MGWRHLRVMGSKIMSKPIIKEHNVSTGEIIEREMNEAELEKFEADQALRATEKAESEAKAIAKSALLDRLGISADEAKLLLS